MKEMVSELSELTSGKSYEAIRKLKQEISELKDSLHFKRKQYDDAIREIAELKEKHKAEMKSMHNEIEYQHNQIHEKVMEKVKEIAELKNTNWFLKYTDALKEIAELKQKYIDRDTLMSERTEERDLLFRENQALKKKIEEIKTKFGLIEDVIEICKYKCWNNHIGNEKAQKISELF